MNKGKKLIGALTLLSLSAGIANAADFNGFSLAVSASASGAKVDGSATNGSTAGSASLGENGVIPSIDAAYRFGSATGGLAVGVEYVPGSVDIATGKSTDVDQSATFKIENYYTIYAQPEYNLNADTAIFAKVGYTSADVKVSSNTTLTNKPGSIDGWRYGVGLKSFFNKNAFVQVEASMTDFDAVRAASSSNSWTADPSLVQGTVSVGYKF
jgi:opacity protein-like surface antigen